MIPEFLILLESSVQNSKKNVTSDIEIKHIIDCDMRNKTLNMNDDKFFKSVSSNDAKNIALEQPRSNRKAINSSRQVLNKDLKSNFLYSVKRNFRNNEMMITENDDVVGVLRRPKTSSQAKKNKQRVVVRKTDSKTPNL